MTTRGNEESKEKKVKNYKKRVCGSMTNDHYIFNIKIDKNASTLIIIAENIVGVSSPTVALQHHNSASHPIYCAR
jgi:hypothetical protein